MINKKNSSFYLRYLAKVTDSSPISYDQIPKSYRDYFSIPALSQTLNISIKYPPVHWSKVENYFEKNHFSTFDNLAEGIRNEFQRSIDKLYAVYFFTTHHIKYDISRSKQKDIEPIPVETIFEIKKGVCSDYSSFFIELAKQSGITSNKMKITEFTNASKGKKHLSFNPPKTPDFKHECVFIEYKGQEYLCDPTWGSGGFDDDDEFSFNYTKSYFLIPYAQGILIYYPKDASISKFSYSFTYEQFSMISKPNLRRELSLESTPFQVIQIDNGQYEMYFSFIQPCDEISSELSHWKDDQGKEIKIEYVFFTCVDNEVPNHMYSIFPDKKRCRYKMSVSFPFEGYWKLKVFVDADYLFEVNFDVLKRSDRILGIPVNQGEESGFIPIDPIEGLMNVDNGMSLIRFAIKMKRSQLIAHLFEIKKETLTRKSTKPILGAERYVTLNLPFKSSSEDKNDRLVEDWLWIKFPKNGLWEAVLYFKQDENSSSYIYGATYYFNVNGVTDRIKNPIYLIPYTRTFVPFTHNCDSYFRIEPSSSTVIIHDKFDFYFTVFSDRRFEIYFLPMDRPKGNSISPILVYEKNTDIRNVKERKYSITVPRYGYYELHIEGKKYIGLQKYVVIYEKLEKESYREKNLMHYLKNQINKVNNYYNDIDETIKTKVKEMLNTSNQSNIIKNEEDPPIVINENNEKRNKIKIEKNDSLIERTQKNDDDDKIELTTIQDENIKLLNKIKILEKEKEMLNSLLKEKEEKEKQMKKEIEEKIKQYEERESKIKIESEQKILELTLKMQKMEKLFNTNPQLLIDAEKNEKKEEENEPSNNDKNEIISDPKTTSRRKRHNKVHLTESNDN